jgi:hypothetical protein
MVAFLLPMVMLPVARLQEVERRAVLAMAAVIAGSRSRKCGRVELELKEWRSREEANVWA